MSDTEHGVSGNTDAHPVFNVDGGGAGACRGLAEATRPEHLRRPAPLPLSLQRFGIYQLENALLTNFAILRKRVYNGFFKCLELLQSHSEF